MSCPRHNARELRLTAEIEIDVDGRRSILGEIDPCCGSHSLPERRRRLDDDGSGGNAGPSTQTRTADRMIRGDAPHSETIPEKILFPKQ